jgi:aconitate hydratase
MPKNIIEKILDNHVMFRGKGAVPEYEVGLRIDQTFMHDATGTMGFQEFEVFGLGQVKTEVSVNYTDHNHLQMGPENADDHCYLQDSAAKYGVIFFENG